MDKFEDALATIRMVGLTAGAVGGGATALIGAKRKWNDMRAKSKRQKLNQGGYIQRGGFYGKQNRANSKELKFYDSSNLGLAADQQVTAAWKGFTVMQDVLLSTEPNGRIGRRIDIKKINIKATITLGARSIDQQGVQVAERSKDEVRIVVVLDKQSNGTDPAPTEIFKEHHILSYRNLSNVDRFKICYDKIHKLEATPVGGLGNTTAMGFITGGDFKHISIQKKVNTPIYFEGGSSSVTGLIKSNKYYIFWIGHHVVIPAEPLLTMSSLELRVRIRYTG